MDIQQKNWYLVEIEVRTEAEEAIEFALNELDSLGTEINNLGKSRTEYLKIIGYFNEKIDDELVRGTLNDALAVYGFPPDAVKNVEWSEVENRDWLAEWKKHWKPTETGRFIIAPTWEKIETDEKIVVRIEPSMAFGTGTHETTRLCLRAIEENLTGQMSFLDVGTGTGILAIAAAKLKSGAAGSKTAGEQTPDAQNKIPKTILACDTDTDSIGIAKENAEINGAANGIDFYVGSISDETPPFDFVCANLTADVIVPLLPLLTAKSKQILVLSGILKEQESAVTGELENFQITDFNVETDGEWISITVKK